MLISYMKNIFYILVFILKFQVSFSQFISGNVFVNTSCQYQISGEYYNLQNQNPITFVYDSALFSYKVLVPITTDSLRICVVPLFCNCDTECRTIIGTSNLQIYFNICISTGQNENSPILSVYPNPFTDVLYIESDGNKKKLMIYDEWGFLVKTEILFSKFNEFNNQLIPGLYTFIIIDEKSTKRFRVIKVK